MLQVGKHILLAERVLKDLVVLSCIYLEVGVLSVNSLCFREKRDTHSLLVFLDDVVANHMCARTTSGLAVCACVRRLAQLCVDGARGDYTLHRYSPSAPAL